LDPLLSILRTNCSHSHYLDLVADGRGVVGRHTNGEYFPPALLILPPAVRLSIGG